MSAAGAFRALHWGGEPLLLPNAWDHASAAAFAAMGFPAVGTTSLGVAAAAGLPDGAGAARDETVELAVALCGGSFLVSADIEGGFSDDPAEVAALCTRLFDAGVVGVNIEDGRADGTLRDIADHVAIVAAVTDAAPDLFVNARTDTAWLKAGTTDDAITRVRAYADAGADGVFVPGVAERADLETIAGAVDVPLNALFAPAGPTIAELGELGVRRVSCGSWLFRVGLQAATDALRSAATGGDAAAFPATAYDDVQQLARDAD